MRWLVELVPTSPSKTNPSTAHLSLSISGSGEKKSPLDRQGLHLLRLLFVHSFPRTIVEHAPNKFGENSFAWDVSLLWLTWSRFCRGEVVLPWEGFSLESWTELKIFFRIFFFLEENVYSWREHIPYIFQLFQTIDKQDCWDIFIGIWFPKLEFKILSNSWENLKLLYPREVLKGWILRMSFLSFLSHF